MSEVYGGYRWERQTKEHLQDPKFLESYGYKVYSQNDEDGILHEIFDRIGTETKKFVEFGVQDGLECNSHYLLHKGWTGLWLEGSELYYQQLRRNFAPVISKGLLKTDCVFITRENIDLTLGKNGYSGKVDLLSIDVDGNDYHIWEEISSVTPRVVCIEYNGRFPPDYAWVMPYFREHEWGGNDYFGASLKALENLGRKKGYQLVGTNLTGVNAFFVRADLAQGKFPEPATAENLYNAPNYTQRHITGHPNEFCLFGENYFFHEPEKEPELSKCRIEIEAADIVMPAGENGKIPVTVKNLGSETILSGRKYPINLAYHILDRDRGEVVVFDGERTPIYDEIGPGAQRDMKMQISIPFNLAPNKAYICRITLVAEGCFWFDDEGGNKTDVSLCVQS